MTSKHETASATLGGTYRAVLVAAGSGFVLQHFVERIWEPMQAQRPLASTLAGLAVFVLLAAAGSTPSRLRFLSSKHLAVATLSVLALYGIVGTVIVQAAPAALYETTYGRAARLIQYLLVDDVFHSMPFACVVGTAAAGLGLSFFRTRTLAPRRLGILAAHGGCLLVLAGAAVQSLAGIKGRLDLHEGESADAFIADTGGDKVVVPLGFSLRLDEFELLSYEPEIRLRVFEKAGAGRRLVASVEPQRAVEDPQSLSGFSVRVTDYWPDHHMSHEVSRARGGEEGVPALGLEPEGGQTLWLLDTGRIEDARARVAEGALVTFFHRQDDARAYAGDEDGAHVPPHVVVTQSGPRRVAVGSTYPLRGRNERFRVQAFYKDLVLDPQTREASDRSDEPRNPALRIELLDAQGTPIGSTWLFANFPSFHSTDSTSPLAGLRYSYEPATGPVESWVAVGETRSIRRLGDSSSSRATDPGALLELGGATVRVVDLIESAHITTHHSTRSERPLRPVVRIEHEADARRVMFLPEGHAAELGGSVHVVLARKEDSDRDYLSTVSVIENGRVVRSQRVEVNHPLSHGGFAFYQSDFHPDDLTYSGFQVVRDPGLPAVYAGFVLCTCGIVLAFYLAPAIRRRRREEA